MSLQVILAYKSAIELSAILDTFDLIQHVKELTHDRGHTPDLVLLTFQMSLCLMLPYQIIAVYSLICL